MESEAVKDERGQARAGGTYEGYATMRRAPRVQGSLLEPVRVIKHFHIGSGYNTCDDKRWSHDIIPRMITIIFRHYCK